MNFTVDDIHRSLRRAIAVVLTEPWKIRTERQPTTPDERPVCVVEAASGVTTGRSRATIPQGNVTKLQAFSAMAYPEIPDEEGGEAATARQSRAGAYAVQQLLDDAFTHGLVIDGQNVGAPFRLPIYDYDGVPVVGRNRQGPSDPYGIAWIDDLNVRALQDPLDVLRWTVVCDLRLSWEAGGRVGLDGPIARAMPPTHVLR